MDDKQEQCKDAPGDHASSWDAQMRCSGDDWVPGAVDDLFGVCDLIEQALGTPLDGAEYLAYLLARRDGSRQHVARARAAIQTCASELLVRAEVTGKQTRTRIQQARARTLEPAQARHDDEYAAAVDGELRSAAMRKAKPE